MRQYVPQYGYYIFGVTHQEDGSLYHKSLAVITTETDKPKNALIQYLRKENLEPLNDITEIENNVAMTSVQIGNEKRRTTIHIEQVKLIRL